MESFQGICFGHACSKVYQYTTIGGKKFFTGLKYVFVKFA
jgi:hypothetical protein